MKRLVIPGNIRAPTGHERRTNMIASEALWSPFHPVGTMYQVSFVLSSLLSNFRMATLWSESNALTPSFDPFCCRSYKTEAPLATGIEYIYLSNLTPYSVYSIDWGQHSPLFKSVSLSPFSFSYSWRSNEVGFFSLEFNRGTRFNEACAHIEGAPLILIPLGILTPLGMLTPPGTLMPLSTPSKVLRKCLCLLEVEPVLSSWGWRC